MDQTSIKNCFSILLYWGFLLNEMSGREDLENIYLKCQNCFPLAKMLARCFESGNPFARHHCQTSPKGKMWIDSKRAMNQIVSAKLCYWISTNMFLILQLLLHFRNEFHLLNYFLLMFNLTWSIFSPTYLSTNWTSFLRELLFHTYWVHFLSTHALPTWQHFNCHHFSLVNAINSS